MDDGGDGYHSCSLVDHNPGDQAEQAGGDIGECLEVGQQVEALHLAALLQKMGIDPVQHAVLLASIQSLPVDGYALVPHVASDSNYSSTAQETLV